MLRRKIDTELELWLHQKHALLVDGARQVGKTFSLKSFADSHFENVVYLNFVEEKEAAAVLGGATNSQDFLFRLSTVVRQPLVPNKTVIFLDEIQELKDFDIVTLSKFLVEEGSYRYMLSGFLLGVSLYNVSSWPVGYMTYLTMYPLDFEEFLWANGMSDSVIEHLRCCYSEKRPVEDYLHDRMMDLFDRYILVGGMPEAVEAYVMDNNFQNVEYAHRAICGLNAKDISKYADIEERLRIREIYQVIPAELNCQSKRFKMSDIGNRKKGDDIVASFEWLRQAGVAIPVHNVKEPVLPLRMSEERSLLKLFMSDVGLLTYSLMDSTVKQRLLVGDKAINYGSIYENVCAQLLTAHGYDRLFYYSNKKLGEIDFVVEKGGDVLPIEVKSGKDYKRHSALNNLLSAPMYGIDEAYVFCPGNVTVAGPVTYYPDYMMEFVHRR